MHVYDACMVYGMHTPTSAPHHMFFLDCVLLLAQQLAILCPCALLVLVMLLLSPLFEQSGGLNDATTIGQNLNPYVVNHLECIRTV
jgi:hypothetical protein